MYINLLLLSISTFVIFSTYIYPIKNNYTHASDNMNNTDVPIFLILVVRKL